MKVNKQPNILFLLAEDICPHLGCYGDPDAITPNLDALAQQGVLYRHVNSVCPVCSAARSCLALGMYPSTVGVANHRSIVRLPDHIKIFSTYLKQNGYFCGINKTDYNFLYDESIQNTEAWDCMIKGPINADSERLPQGIADAWNQADGKPFFMMSTFACCHQSRYGFPSTPEEHRRSNIPRMQPCEYQDRSKLTVPNYHYDTKETREIWGQYHETITTMDRMVGETLSLLKKDGLEEETIIIFTGDNGMGIPAGKSYLWMEGTDVPLIVYLPSKYRHLCPNFVSGKTVEHAVNFTDFAPTILSLASITPPSHMNGCNFLNPPKKDDVSYSIRNRVDTTDEFVRTIRTSDYLYIRNFYPFQGFRFTSYMERMAPYFTNSWKAELQKNAQSCYDRRSCFGRNDKPVEELYLLKNDPAQMHNVAGDKTYANILLEMRKTLRDFMLKHRDLGFYPEIGIYEFCKENAVTAYELGQDEKNYPLAKIYDFVERMTFDTVEDVKIKQMLSHDNPLFRYWAIQSIRQQKRTTLYNELEIFTEDCSLPVRIAAMEACILQSTDHQRIFQMITNILDNESLEIVLQGLMCICRTEQYSPQVIQKTQQLKDGCTLSEKGYNMRYVQPVEDLANYYPHMFGQYHQLLQVNDKLQPRLDVLRTYPGE